MTTWLLSFGYNWAFVPVACWLVWKFWKATSVPSLKYLQHSDVRTAPPPILSRRDRDWLDSWRDHAMFPSIAAEPPQPFASRLVRLVDVVRRTGLYPWGAVKETWLVTPQRSVREGDGVQASPSLHLQLWAVVEVALARQAETEELVK